ncbi:creatininase family protein [Edwardsiella tarda]
MKKVMLNELTGREIRELLQSGQEITAIVSFGSCENHADHLPLGPDMFVPEEVARRVAQRMENTLVLPCTPFGTSVHYNVYPLAVTLRYETNIALAEDIFASLLHHGIRRILVINGHDGNIPAIEIAAHNVKARHPQAAMVVVPAWWDLVGHHLGKGFFDSWDNTGLGHGGEGETSAVMALRPELVDLQYAQEQIPQAVFADYGVNRIWNIGEISATGATGDPRCASAEKGERILACLVNVLCTLLSKLDATDWKCTAS